MVAINRSHDLKLLMMSASQDHLSIAEWQAQFSLMRKALDELKPFNPDQALPLYGEHLFLESELLSSDSDDTQSALYLSDVDLPETTEPGGSSKWDSSWLRKTCHLLAAVDSGLDGNTTYEQVLALLVTHSDSFELQSSLVELLGFNELDLVSEIISHQKEIVESVSQAEGPTNSQPQCDVATREERHLRLRRLDYEHKTAPLAASTRAEEVHYPHVYRKYEAGNVLSAYGSAYTLPVGSTRHNYERYEMYSIPANKVGGISSNTKRIEISSLDGICRRTFSTIKSLNRMQSLVYPVAYNTNENMLICAPTGAGKTGVAMLAVLSLVAKHVEPNPSLDPQTSEFKLADDDFKIVYVAPLKALAAEVTEKFSQSFAWLGLNIREFTGDIQLSRAEILRTHMIVTTPEKWDVVTRKSTGDTHLVQKVKLLIVDEVHMLHDDRGTVLESLIARTQRQVESTQSMIRVVGLSATLPNYIDVADFLKVNRMVGLFYFDSSFRPVPLEQHFIGVRGKPNSKISKENLDQTVFDKTVEMLRQGHQLMVFVHSRKDTVRSAKDLHDKATENDCLDLFDPSGHPEYELALTSIRRSKGREIRDLLPKGMGTHHAGMPRSDRNIIENLFLKGVIKVLCCTSTLAWGVNLPAAAVIIKGTQIYSAEAGKMIDLGILDVLQIFGRAGRPQFQDTGIAFLITTLDKLSHYLTTVTQQKPIESNFSKKLIDNLNAEVALGTVSSVKEGLQWLGYSYLFVRMRKNPLAYGLEWSDLRDDPHLVQRRQKLITEAARVLHKSQMIVFNEGVSTLRSKEIGRIASQFYVSQKTCEIFNSMMKPLANEAEILEMLSMSEEFEQIQSRETEEEELMNLRADYAPFTVKGRIGTSHGKTNILLQAYVSRASVEDFTLVSDMNYVSQNAARISRALFMMALNRRWGYQCVLLLGLCKSIERQIWTHQHPLRQFELPFQIIKNLEMKESITSIESLKELSHGELGNLVNNRGMGRVLARLVQYLPLLSIQAELVPLNREVIRVQLDLTPQFKWSDMHHGSAQSYWVWVENSETSEIYHHEYFVLPKKKFHQEHQYNFTIPLSDPLPTQIYVHAVSEHWLGAESVSAVSFQHLIRPDTETILTDLLNLQPLPITALKNPILQELYGQRFHFFNPMQTQLFHVVYHTSENVLLGSPTGSGKTLVAELALFAALRDQPGSKVVYIAPMKALVRERVEDWRSRLAQPTGLTLTELTGDYTPDIRSINKADIIVTTPEKWDGISRSWKTRSYVQKVSLVIFDEIHLLGGDRGPILEIIVSRMKYIQRKSSLRLLGMSTACSNPIDLADWLGVDPNIGLFNFRHSVRPVPLEIYIDGFPDQRIFCRLMQAMNRPTFLAILNHSPTKPVIVFVPSRRQTRLTAKDLINFCGMEDNPKRFLHMPEEDLNLNLARVKDENLKESITFGIGLHHAGLKESDRSLVEELFLSNKIQVLVATSTLAWGVNLPAHLVVVKGTMFFDAKNERYKDMDLTDVLQMLGRAGRPQFDDSGVARIFTQESRKDFYKHFLHTGFPVESSLHKSLTDHLGADIASGRIKSKQDCMEYLTWTFLHRTIRKNPTFYGIRVTAEQHNTPEMEELVTGFLSELIDESLGNLAISKCIDFGDEPEIISSTRMGEIMSYYYVSHKTIRLLLTQIESNPVPSFSNVLAWVSAASEYDELPVRHNEDLINADMALTLPFKIKNEPILCKASTMGDPHIKAFLLFQTHMLDLDEELPITDYVGDLHSVLDQSPRILRAAEDVFAELQNEHAKSMAVKVQECIKAKLWPVGNLESSQSKAQEKTHHS